MNVIDAENNFTQKRRFDQHQYGVSHSEKYAAKHFKENEYPTDSMVLIEVYSGYSPGLCIAAGGNSWLVTLTRDEAVQLAKDIFSSIE